MAGDKEEGALSSIVLKGPELNWYLSPSSELRPHLSIDTRSLCSFSAWTLACVLRVAIFLVGVDLGLHLEAE